MTALVSSVIQRAHRTLTMVSSTGAQNYSQEAMLEAVITAFELYHEEHEFPDYVREVIYPLDGTLGVTTTTPDEWDDPLREFRNIIHIIPEGQRRKLIQPSPNYPWAEMTGTVPKYYIYDSTRVFKVLPYTSTGNIYIRYKTKPAEISIDTTLPMDSTLLALAASVRYLAMDGSNPEGLNRLEIEVAKRENQLSHASIGETPLNPWEEYYPTQNNFEI